MSRILFFLKVPPPFTGSTYINKLINESKVINDSFEIQRIQISYKKSLESRKSFSLYKLLKIVQYHFFLLKCLIRFKPEIVYFQISPLGWAFLRDFTYVLVIKLSGKHIVYHLHGKGISESASKSFLLLWLYRFVFNNSSIICVSNSLTNDIKTVFSSVPYIVPNAIPLFENTKEEGRQNDKFRILFLSNILRSKGFIDFLDSVELFHAKREGDYEALIVGTAVDFTVDQIEKEISKRGLKKAVHYMGPLYGIEKQNILFRSDVLIFPTLNDVWGLVILEAMQAGLTVIATAEGAIPEIVDNGVTGFLVDKQSPEQISEKLQVFFKNPELGKKMGAAGKKKFLEKYTFEIFELNLKNVFEDVAIRIKKSK